MLLTVAFAPGGPRPQVGTDRHENAIQQSPASRRREAWATRRSRRGRRAGSSASVCVACATESGGRIRFHPTDASRIVASARRQGRGIGKPQSVALMLREPPDLDALNLAEAAEEPGTAPPASITPRLIPPFDQCAALITEGFISCGRTQTDRSRLLLPERWQESTSSGHWSEAAASREATPCESNTVCGRRRIIQAVRAIARLPRTSPRSPGPCRTRRKCAAGSRVQVRARAELMALPPPRVPRARVL